MNNLKALRKEKHETQAQIAALMGINVKTVSRWENGEFDIKPAQARMLADYFNVSVGYLLGDTDDRFPYDDEKVIDDYVKYGLILTSSRKRLDKEVDEHHFFNFVQYLKSSPFLLTDTEINFVYNLLKTLNINTSETLKGKLFQDVLFTKAFSQYEEQFSKDYSIIHSEKYEKSENEILLDTYLKELKIDIGVDGIISILKPIVGKNNDKLNDDT